MIQAIVDGDLMLGLGIAWTAISLYAIYAAIRSAAPQPTDD